MYLDPGDRPSLTPQLAMRVAILGGIALLAFAFVFFRLWYLQVLSGDTYRAEANDNRIRQIKVQAPRGEIVDRDGRVLVENRVALAVKVSPKLLPDSEAERREVYARLARVLDMRPRGIERRVEKQLRELPYAMATVKQDVDYDVVAYLLEHRADFPGVEPERVFVRQYPQGETGAHLFGYSREISQEQLDSGRFPDATMGDIVGKDGIEAQYDRFLRGRNGATRVQVDALGRVRGEQLKAWAPEQGRQLRLALDLDVQEAGQAALTGRLGGFVAMDVDSGEVVGLGSAPSFDPNFFSRPFTAAEYKALESEEAGKPLLNRAIQGNYPAGSTFKLVTATAALEGGLIGTGDVVNDGGSIRIGDIDFINAGRTVNGPVDLRRALSVSSDVYFYLLGQEADSSGDGLLIQRWAHKLGIGRETGIDLPNEQIGRVPTPEWRNDWYERGLTKERWTVGHNVNFSIGQGDLLTNPLQMAIAYATIANGGKVVKPHLGLRIEDSTGRVLQELATPPARRVDVAPEYRQAILDGLYSAANEPGGTSTPVFETFPVEIAGKTGTAETPQGDQSWYVALAPYPNPRYVVAATIERGGFGAETAAPAVRQILTALLDVDDDGEVLAGTAQD
ncbi:MAG TPA: penicillin-binding protein 2 [Thermoleophilaceae bacterium]|nr:penicillin-binding protein 2 [Thermoleophilaceae bacterium]